MIEEDPYGRARLPAGSKRVVTFLHGPPPVGLTLPIVLENARVVAVGEREVFSSYVPGPHGPVFMQLIEKTFGKDVTTRTWETIQKTLRACEPG